jgi:hypothetical protein
VALWRRTTMSDDRHNKNEVTGQVSRNGKTARRSELREAREMAGTTGICHTKFLSSPIAHRPQVASTPPPTRGEPPQKITLVFFAPIFCSMSNVCLSYSPRSHPAATRVTTQPPGFVKHVKNIGRAYLKQATVLIACYRQQIPASKGSAELRR